MVTYKINTRWNKKNKKNGGGNQGGYPAFKDKEKKKSVKEGERVKVLLRVFESRRKEPAKDRVKDRN